MGIRAPDIDFAPRAPARSAVAFLALIAAAACCIGVLWYYFASAGKLQRIDAAISVATDTAERRRSARPAESAPTIAPTRITAINGAIARLNVPWGELFAAFEAERPKNVALLALLPDARKRSLIVQAEATTPQAMVEFVERLRGVPLFEDAFLLKHERRDQETGQPYRFAVEVRWKDVP